MTGTGKAWTEEKTEEKKAPPPLVGGGWGEGSCGPQSTRESARARARTLRHDATPAERQLWGALHNKQIDGLKFRRQVPLGPYIADFFCISVQLVVELDGISHIDSAEADARRDVWMQARGIRVLRFSNADVLGNLEGVITAIREFVRTTPPPNPLPQGEGESFSPLSSLATSSSASPSPSSPRRALFSHV